MRTPVNLSFWQLGINSLLPPVEIAKQQYAWGENILNRGGVVQTRPGRKIVATIAGDRAQGMIMFKPVNFGESVLVMAVDGYIYYMAPPAFTPVYLGIRMNPLAEKVYFCKTLKSVEYNPDGSLRLITPRPVLMISDGENYNTYWDGTIVNTAFGIPVCTWMSWVASRLWMAQGSKIFVGDLSDPVSHTEGIYLAERDAFELSGPCTGLIATPNRSGLLAFTEDTTTAFKANIRDRTLWAKTEGFQDELFQNVGCVAGRTACNQYGVTHWLSDKGLVNLDAALFANRSNKLITEDEAMMRSRRKLSLDPSGACAAAYENLLLCSVPSGCKYNNHTWVMDQAPIGTQTNGGGVWASVWTGTCPVEWAQGTMGRRKRIFSLCFDQTLSAGVRIHVWEDMLSDKLDNGGKIASQWITGGIGSSELVRFKFAKFEAVEILGEVKLNVSVCGTRGPWYDIGSYYLSVDEGSIGSRSMPEIVASSHIEAYKSQSRPLVTKDFISEGMEVTPEHSPYSPGVDRAFQLCFEWTGKMGIRELTVVLADGPAESHGKPACAGDIGERGELNAITEKGEGV